VLFPATRSSVRPRCSHLCRPWTIIAHRPISLDYSALAFGANLSQVGTTPRRSIYMAQQNEHSMDAIDDTMRNSQVGQLDCVTTCSRGTRLDVMQHAMHFWMDVQCFIQNKGTWPKLHQLAMRRCVRLDTRFWDVTHSNNHTDDQSCYVLVACSTSLRRVVVLL
jgi:hypothetical protein